MQIGPITVLVLLCSSTSGVSAGQVNQVEANGLTRLFETRGCRHNCQSRQLLCEAVFLRSVDTKKNKAGDRILMRTNLVTGSGEEPVTMLDAGIMEVRSNVNGRSVLRIRIDKAVRKDGRELPVEATIVALASQSSVTERWDSPAIIFDRLPRIPEDDERLPGEVKLSEDQRHTSPLDSMPDLPVHYKVVCPGKEKKASAIPCTNLLEARGVYGHEGVTLEPADPSSPAESVLTSKKNIPFRAGTVLVLEMKNITIPAQPGIE